MYSLPPYRSSRWAWIRPAAGVNFPGAAAGLELFRQQGPYTGVGGIGAVVVQFQRIFIQVKEQGRDNPHSRYTYTASSGP